MLPTRVVSCNLGLGVTLLLAEDCHTHLVYPQTERAWEFMFQEVLIGRNGIGPVFQSAPSLCSRGLWLSKRRYWSACLDFLYTLKDKLPSWFLWIRVSNMAILLSCSCSTVNLMTGCNEFKCLVELSTSEGLICTLCRQHNGHKTWE